MSEKSEILTFINTGDSRFEVRRDNLSVFRHLGAGALFDHCFIVGPAGESFYIWAEDPDFDVMVSLAEQHHAEIALNIEKPQNFDVERYMEYVSDDLRDSDFIPDDWLPLSER